MWLESNYTSSDPKVVGGYFIRVVEQMKGCPKRIRGDRGTENIYIQQIQSIFSDIHSLSTEEVQQISE